jgi:hypothetical protein
VQQETAAQALRPDFEVDAASKRPAGFEVEELSYRLPAVSLLPLAGSTAATREVTGDGELLARFRLTRLRYSAKLRRPAGRPVPRAQLQGKAGIDSELAHTLE